ncbi:hypothetical protein ACOMHN_014843 [Nucella lapillus]
MVIHFHEDQRDQERLHQRCLRSILNIHWSDFVTNVEVLEQAEITSIEAMMLKTATLGRAHLQDGGPSPAKDRPIRTLSRNANIDAETNNRISKTSSALRRLREKVWERRGISLKTKLKVYRAVVLTALLYGCETWTVYRRHEKQINHFHLRCLRNILHIRWQDKVSDTERVCLSRIGLTSHQRACTRRAQRL